MSEAFARASGALEADTAPEPDEEALALCADAAYTCFDAAELSPSACLDTYIGCAVESGVPADHDYLVCLGALSGCWAEVVTTEDADACYYSYDGCIAEVAVAPDPDEPGDPDDNPTEPEGPVEACAYAADDCLFAVSEDDRPGQAACIGGFAECLLEAGVDPEEPYLGCLAGAETCLSAGSDSIEDCWYGFELCYDENYGSYEDPTPDPDGHPDDRGDGGEGTGLCEAETLACYDEGGTNLECLGVLDSCLLASGVPEDHPYMLCLDGLIACAGPAEASTDPDLELEVCADTFNQCLEANGY